MSYPQRNGEQHKTWPAAGRPGITGESGRTVGLIATKGRTRDERRRWWQRAGVLAILAGLAVLMAACSSPSPRPSRPGPGAYTACMRKHGVTGALASPPGMSLPTSGPNGRGRGVPILGKVSAALQACQSLAPLPGQSSGPG